MDAHIFNAVRQLIRALKGVGLKIHILGIAGTFMGGIAQLAKAMGVTVSGSDHAVYPPMSTQLEQAGIEVMAAESLEFLQQAPDAVVIGNALSRGHPAVEATLNTQQVYTSGPQWLADHVLKDRWVIAVAGTHGKTSTASMAAWILEYAGLAPGFLIGGVPENFGVSARLGDAPFFVVEADEYDTAFFDKRSKFVHYHPRTCVLNNLEFDHADIFDSLAAIQRQFHHLMRTIPGNGLVVMPNDDLALEEVIAQGCWTPIQSQGDDGDWSAVLKQTDASVFEVFYQQQSLGEVDWPMSGAHNVRNALSAIAAAVHCGVPPRLAVEALSEFKGIRRRMTLVDSINDIQVYDDFAHHPTAIATSLEGVRAKMRQQASNKGRLIAVFEPRSNTMRLGIHRHNLPLAFDAADVVFGFVDPDWHWHLDTAQFQSDVTLVDSYDKLYTALLEACQPQDRVVIMSNGSFGGLHQKLVEGLKQKYPAAQSDKGML